MELMLKYFENFQLSKNIFSSQMHREEREKISQATYID